MKAKMYDYTVAKVADKNAYSLYLDRINQIPNIGHARELTDVDGSLVAIWRQGATNEIQLHYDNLVGAVYILSGNDLEPLIEINTYRIDIKE